MPSISAGPRSPSPAFAARFSFQPHTNQEAGVTEGLQGLAGAKRTINSLKYGLVLGAFVRRRAAGVLESTSGSSGSGWPPGVLADRYAGRRAAGGAERETTELLGARRGVWKTIAPCSERSVLANKMDGALASGNLQEDAFGSVRDPHIGGQLRACVGSGRRVRYQRYKNSVGRDWISVPRLGTGGGVSSWCNRLPEVARSGSRFLIGRSSRGRRHRENRRRFGDA